MGKSNRGKKNPDVMPVNLGSLLAEKIKEKRLSKAEIARKINRATSAVRPLLKRPSMQVYLLWELSIAINYNFFEQLSEQLIKKVGTQIGSGNASTQQTLANMQKENEQLRTENTYLKKAIDALAK